MPANEKIALFSHHQMVSKTIDMQAHYIDDWHTHPWHQVIFPVSGLLQSTIEQNTVIVPHNAMLYIPANTRHKSVAVTHTQFLTLYLNPNHTVSFSSTLKSCFITPFLKSLILLLIDHAHCNNTEQMLSNLLIVLRDQITIANPYEIPLLIPSDRRLMSIFIQLQKQPDSALTLTQWAEKVGASGRTLSRLCSKEFGQSFSSWRQHIKLVLSLQLLESPLSIQSIAIELGYHSDSAFIHAFKSIFTQTPSQYRKSHLSHSGTNLNY